MITVTRTHEICAGHRVVGHEGKCKHLHGHQYRFEFTLTADTLDSVGRVIDFSVIKSKLCNWLEENLDHRMILWSEDPDFYTILMADLGGVYKLPVNPTAENIAQYVCETIAPELLIDTNVRLIEVKLWETSKCCATYHVKEENDKPFRDGRKDLETTKSRFEESVQKT